MYGGTPEQNKEYALEDLGSQIDRIENLLAAMRMPIDPAHHLEALKESLPEIKSVLKKAYFELGGDDVWST